MSRDCGRTGFAVRPLIIVVALGLAVPVLTTPMFAAGPQITVQQEAKAHPRIAKGIKDMEATLQALTKAPDDFGGNKAKAEADIKQAIHSLKKALLHRLNMDDAAIDKANL